MSYAFKPGESIPDAIRRIVAEELESAAGHLEGHGDPDRDEAIHEARKNIKKIRAVLKLMRPELAGAYAGENARFREIGRKLSAFRDAGAMLETFDQLSKKYRKDWGGRDVMASIRARLLEEKASHELASGVAEVLVAGAAELRSLQSQVEQWPLAAGGFNALAPGLEQTYQSGRRAMQSAVRKPVPERFHDWRKRAKDHWYHVRLLARMCGDALTFYQDQLKHLESCLGDDHNLAVLRLRIEHEPQAYGTEAAIQMFLATVEKHQTGLRSTAFAIGREIYQDKPKVFGRQLRNLWDAWEQDRARLEPSTADKI